jgi:hypothetical protein
MLLRVDSISDVTGPVIFALCGALVLVGCGDDPTGDDDVGESSSESTGESESGESTDDSTGSTDAETSSDSTETDATDTSDTDSTESDVTETNATDDTDSTETGDLSCEDDSYLGDGIASDGWGIGDLCDEIWVCADDEEQAALIQAAVPDAVCEPGLGCPVSHCTISYQTIVDEAVFADVCAALMVPGIDEAHCLVLGP